MQKGEQGLFFLVSISTLLILSNMFLVLGDSNGVWYGAEDIRGGTFGADEQAHVSIFSFIGLVTFDSEVYILEDLALGKENPSAELDVNGSIRANNLKGLCPQSHYLNGFDENGEVICHKIDLE